MTILTTGRARASRLLAALIATILVCAGAAACGSSTTNATTYVPAAYGQQVGSTFDCYFVDDIGEVTDLIRAGLCPAGSVATVMPLSWEEEYWSYYSSTAYVNTYMPSQYRSHYTSVTVVSFSSHYGSQITAASSHATYKSNTGKTVAGTSKLKFGTGSSGSSSGGSAVHGGGSVRCAKSENMTTIQEKSGTSGSSGSHGGGSARSGGSSSSKSGTKTTTGSGSLGGC